MAVQQVDRLSFGTGRIEIFPPGAAYPIALGIVNDATVALTSDLKEIFGEGKFAAAAADGHVACEITAKHYALNLADVANDFGVAAPAASITAVAFDELGVVPTTPYTVPLTNAAQYIPGTLDLSVYIVNAGKPYPVKYAIVADGTAVAGQSASVTAGVIKFAAGDTGLAFSATYQYGNVTGKSILITNQYQNSAPTYSMKLWKRDRSPVDGSVGILQAEFFAVRPGGITMPFNEGNFSNFEKKYRAYSDPSGNVVRLTFVNV